MIADAVLGILVGLVRAVLRLLPTVDVELPTEQVQALAGAALHFDGYFPVRLAMQLAAAVLAVKVALVVWRLIVWLYERFPGKFS